VETPGGVYDIILNADNPDAAVVLTTGGFAGNEELKAEYFVNAEFGVNTNIANTVFFVDSPASARLQYGDGQLMGRQVGAALDMMHAVTTRAQGIPGQNINNISNENLPFQDNFMSGAMPRTQGLLYINVETGRRFTNEPNVPTYDFWDEDGVPVYQFGIMTHTGVIEFKSITNWYTSGLFTRADTFEEAAAIMGLTGDALENFLDEMAQVQHVAAHNVPGVSQADAIAAAQNCDDPDCPHHGVAVSEDFSTNAGNVITAHLWGSGPYYVTTSRIVPILHGTYGGVRININGQVVRGTDTHHMPETLEEAALEDVIPGLFAAGTVARPPRTAAPNIMAGGVWGIAAANTILGLPSFDNSYWEE
jgi:succinate dehydrogenase/fumarate reductase flavoprotein subunit